MGARGEPGGRGRRRPNRPLPGMQSAILEASSVAACRVTHATCTERCGPHRSRRLSCFVEAPTHRDLRRARSGNGGHLESESGGLSGHLWSAGDLQSLSTEPSRADRVIPRTPHVHRLTTPQPPARNVRSCRLEARAVSWSEGRGPRSAAPRARFSGASTSADGARGGRSGVRPVKDRRGATFVTPRRLREERVLHSPARL